MLEGWDDYVHIEKDIEDIHINFTKDDDCDSNDERYMTWWLRSMKQQGYVLFAGRPSPIQLSHPIKGLTWRPAKRGSGEVKKKFSVKARPLVFTPDFIIIWDPVKIAEHPEHFQYYTQVWDPNEEMHYMNFGRTEEFQKNAFFHVFSYEGKAVSIIDIKPEAKARSFGNKHRMFPAVQKLCFHELGIYIQDFVLIKNKVPELFRDFSCPSRYLKTDKSSRNRKLHFSPKRVFL